MSFKKRLLLIDFHHDAFRANDAASRHPTTRRPSPCRRAQHGEAVGRQHRGSCWLLILFPTLVAWHAASSSRCRFLTLTLPNTTMVMSTCSTGSKTPVAHLSPWPREPPPPPWPPPPDGEIEALVGISRSPVMMTTQIAESSPHCPCDDADPRPFYLKVKRATCRGHLQRSLFKSISSGRTMQRQRRDTATSVARFWLHPAAQPVVNPHFRTR